MSRLLKSDFYRLFRSKSFYICGFISVFLFLLNLTIAYLTNKMLADNNEINSFLAKDGISYGLGAFGNGNLQMILGIITAIFITSEFTHGTMKNVVSKGFSRIQIYFSKLITMIFAVYIMIFATFVTGMIGAIIVTGKVGDFSADNMIHMTKIIGVELILNMALASFLVFIAMVIRNLGGAIAINILGVMSFLPLIFYLLEIAVKNKVKFSYVELLNNIAAYLPLGTIPDNYLRSVIVAIVYFGVTTALGLLAFTKSDVK